MKKNTKPKSQPKVKSKPVPVNEGRTPPKPKGGSKRLNS